MDVEVRTRHPSHTAPPGLDPTAPYPALPPTPTSTVAYVEQSKMHDNRPSLPSEDVAARWGFGPFLQLILPHFRKGDCMASAVVCCGPDGLRREEQEALRHTGISAKTSGGGWEVHGCFWFGFVQKTSPIHCATMNIYSRLENNLGVFMKDNVLR